MPDINARTVTRLLEAVADGDADAKAPLVELLYEQLRTLARAKMAREKAGHTLQPTALVHEVYLRLLDGPEPCFENRGHFLAASAEAMRWILIDRARRVGAQKRGGDRKRVPVDEEAIAIAEPSIDVLALDEALTSLEKRDPRSAQVVKLRYFAGLNNDEVAEALGLAPRTVRQDWLVGKTWLCQQLQG